MNLSIPEAFTLAVQHHQAGRLAEAETIYRQILAAEPKHIEAQHHLGVIAQQMGRRELAMELIGRAIALDPNNAAAHSNLGEVYRTLWLLDEAIASYRRALTLQPEWPVVHNNLGNVLRERGQFDEAIAACRHAISLKPDHAEAYNNLGNALFGKECYDEAIAAYRRALELAPHNVEAHNNLALALRQIGQLDQALAAFRRALEIAPDRSCASSDLILTLHTSPGEERQTIAAEQRHWSRRLRDRLKAPILPHANDRNPERRLRIGYVSPDFRDHVVGRNLVPLVRCHDHEKFEILCYAGVARPDQTTEIFRRHADQWRSTLGLEDEALAAMIRADGVDILVDLSQHSAGNRLPVFARRPAPTQVSFAGYPAGTGLEAIRYRISDRWLEPSGVEIETQAGKERPPGVPHLPAAETTERSASVPYPGEDIDAAPTEQLCLIESFWCYDPCGTEIAVNTLPARKNGWVTFGSLNSFTKVNEPLLKLWARVLAQTPTSRLLLLCGAGSPRQRTLEILAREGVAASRIDFVPRLPLRAYLEQYQNVDIVLDPYPYNGHTTSLDALWMGAPVVSLSGESSVSRAGLSMLSNLGLPELVAQSEEEYVRIAIKLAADLNRLAELRATLRPRMEASVLMDAPRFTLSIEAAYRTMWRQWCGEEKAP